MHENCGLSYLVLQCKWHVAYFTWIEFAFLAAVQTRDGETAGALVRSGPPCSPCNSAICSGGRGGYPQRASMRAL